MPVEKLKPKKWYDLKSEIQNQELIKTLTGGLSYF
jgi:hypothetical protein